VAGDVRDRRLSCHRWVVRCGSWSWGVTPRISWIRCWFGLNPRSVCGGSLRWRWSPRRNTGNLIWMMVIGRLSFGPRPGLMSRMRPLGHSVGRLLVSGDAPEVAEQLASGEISFDRAQQLARLPAEHRSGHQGHDIGQLKRLVADHKRLTRRRERKMGNGFLHFGSSDELATTFWGELPGLDARILEKAVDQRADEIIPADQKLAVAERRALALAAICQDSLYLTDTGSESAPVDVAVIVDAETAVETGGERGVSVVAGPRLGPGALEEILCKGNVDLVGLTEKGRPLDLGRRSRTVGRKLRRHVLHRDRGCTVEGCSSRYRLEAHHVIAWSHGGRTDADNLITLCWFHHHVSVHREGLQIIRIGTSRVRLKRPR
jgi:Domain of unknown function (DUF222)/HNH endonuclease